MADIQGGAPDTGLPPYMSATPRETTVRLLPTDNVAERQRQAVSPDRYGRPTAVWRRRRVPEDAVARLSGGSACPRTCPRRCSRERRFRCATRRPRQSPDRHALGRDGVRSSSTASGISAAPFASSPTAPKHSRTDRVSCGCSCGFAGVEGHVRPPDRVEQDCGRAGRVKVVLHPLHEGVPHLRDRSARRSPPPASSSRSLKASSRPSAAAASLSVVGVTSIGAR